MGILKSVGKFFKSIGRKVEPFALTEADKAIAAIKASPTGAQIISLIGAAEASGQPNGTKLANVLAAAMPLVLDIVTAGGRAAVLADVETVTRSVIESTLADIKGVPIITAILAALGVK